MRSFFFLLFSLSLIAEEIEIEEMNFSPYPTPWFIGPLLAHSARVVKPRHWKVQMYWQTFVRVGDYDSHWKSRSVESFYHEEVRVQFKLGLIDRIDFQVVPQFIYRHTKGARSLNFGDLPLSLGIQILRPMTLEEGPNLKLSLLAMAPTGKYRHLNKYKKRVDATGTGCWFPGLGLSLSQFWYLSGVHYLELRASTSYRLGVPVRVRGVNFYGGDEATSGKVKPGNYTILDTALQYSITQEWGVSCDFLYERHNRTRFSGKGYLAKDPSSDAFSMAPAFQYNFSKDLGIIGGVWFTLAGRNIAQFLDGILSLGAYF